MSTTDLTATAQSGVSCAELKQLTENVPVMLAVFDAATMRCIYANKRYAALTGRDHTQLIGQAFETIVGAATFDAIKHHIHRATTQREAVNYSRALAMPNGEIRHLDVSFAPDARAGVDRLYVLISDVTQRRVTEIALEQSAERLRKFMAASAEGIAFHIDGIITDVNLALTQMLGYSAEEFIGKSTLEFVPAEEHERVRAVIQSGAETSYESRALHKTRGAIAVEYIVRDMVWEGVFQRMVIVRDLSERNTSEQRIRFLALHDALSGLPNRASLDEHLLALVAARPVQPFATLFIDVDQLKRVNDSLGHAAGDQLLTELSQRLSTRLSQQCLASSQIPGQAWLARIGGDEFVATYLMQDEADLKRFVDAVMASFEAPFRVEHREIRVSASAGITVYPKDGNTPSQLLKNADAAMYVAKGEGRDTVRYFDASLARRADLVLETSQALATAVQGNQFRLYFQPLLSADGKELLGAEALLRWQHPERGLLAPDEFIHIAEEGHLIVTIGHWVLAEALRHVKHWISLGWVDARVAVNLSSNEFSDAGFTDFVLNALADAKLDGTHLEFEFTERMLMDVKGDTRASLDALKAAGIALAIDDFGTGFSSFSRLRAMPIDTLKIDQSFVADIPDSHSALAIVTALLQLGRGLSIDVLAEGVETESQRECLELLGCSMMQGYLFAKPMSGDDFCAWMQAHRQRNQHSGPRVRHRLRRAPSVD
jgi:diguanylate cyclase (GGDEF)-like protein/PAS domain S-box-containing protein